MDKDFDVIVIGGGPAGIGAAISSSKHGQKVLVLEKDNALGGAISNMLVMPYMPYWTGKDKFNLVQGVFAELNDRYLKLKEELDGKDTECLEKPVTVFNEEYMKIVVMQMFKDYGVKVLYHSLFISSKTVEKRITEIKAVVNGIEICFTAKVFIDCTGNADVAYKSNYNTFLGRETDHLCQPMTLCFRVGNVDRKSFLNSFWDPETKKYNNYLNNLYIKEKKLGRITNPREDVLWFGTVTPNIFHFNTTRVLKRNPVDPEDLSLAEEEGREQVLEMYKFLKKNAIGFEKAVLLSTASHIGIRESRMIEGEYVLTKEDIISCKKFEDGVVACNYELDMHSPDGGGTTHHFFKQDTYYTIPYRCLVPKDSVNLLVAGRCISSTHDAQSSYRVIPFAMALGEAAGVAAFVANKNKTTIKNTDTNEIIKLLRDDGAFVGKELPHLK